MYYFKELYRVKLLSILCLFGIGQLAVSVLFNLDSLVVSRGDSKFYFQASRQVSELDSFERMYSGYIILLHLSRILSDSGLIMILIHSFFVIVSAYAVYSLAEEVGGTLAAWISTSFYLLFPMLAQWTRYILTESLFYSLILIGMRLATMKRSWVVYFFYPLVLFLVFLRPNGFLISCALLSIHVLNRQSKFALTSVLTVFVWFVGSAFAFFFVSRSGIGTESVESTIFEKTLEGNVVYGVKELFFQMPTPKSADRSNISFLKYLLDYPLANLRIGALRIYWEMKQVRPWYSSYLNTFLATSMILFYFFSFIGFLKSDNKRYLIYVLIVSAPSMLLVGITWAIWEGRFGWWFLITWIPFSGFGAASIFGKIFRKRPERAESTGGVEIC